MGAGVEAALALGCLVGAGRYARRLALSERMREGLDV